jgi:hypothetical protein
MDGSKENEFQGEHFAGARTLDIHVSVSAENDILSFSPLRLVTTFS